MLMKKEFLAILSGAFIFQYAFAQPVSQAVPGTKIVQPSNESELPKVAKFDLDFPGGTPQQLIDRISKAVGKQVNAIIPLESAEVQLPPLKMRDVTIPAVFDALMRASTKLEKFVTGTYFNSVGGPPNEQFATREIAYGFKLVQVNGSEPVWYFYDNRISEKDANPSVCRFYQLEDFLKDKYKVEDITTAIQTGWKLAGVKDTPTLKFHPETGLLIAVGRLSHLKTIDSVLEQLRLTLPKPSSKTTPLASKEKDGESGKK